MFVFNKFDRNWKMSHIYIWTVYKQYLYYCCTGYINSGDKWKNISNMTLGQTFCKPREWVLYTSGFLRFCGLAVTNVLHKGLLLKEKKYVPVQNIKTYWDHIFSFRASPCYFLLSKMTESSLGLVLLY